MVSSLLMRSRYTLPDYSLPISSHSNIEELGQPRNYVSPAGIEPTFPALETGLLATGPLNDCQINIYTIVIFFCYLVLPWIKLHRIRWLLFNLSLYFILLEWSVGVSSSINHRRYCIVIYWSTRFFKCPPIYHHLPRMFHRMFIVV